MKAKDAKVWAEEIEASVPLADIVQPNRPLIELIHKVQLDAATAGAAVAIDKAADAMLELADCIQSTFASIKLPTSFVMDSAKIAAEVVGGES